MLIEEGWDIRLIAQRLGHADPSITLRTYTHLINRHQQPEAVSLGSILPLAKGENPNSSERVASQPNEE